MASQGGPEGLRASLRLGWCRWQQGRTGEAVALLDRAADHPTLSSYALLWAGQAALESRDPRGAVRRLALALQRAGPASVRAASHLLLAQARLQLAEPASAEAEAQKALRTPGDEERAAAGSCWAARPSSWAGAGKPCGGTRWRGGAFRVPPLPGPGRSACGASWAGFPYLPLPPGWSGPAGS
jgi:tetratricopeptide (TPR) repeat protein